jgi:hypothetical protein
MGLLVGLLLAPVAALPIHGLREVARRALVRAREQAEMGRVPSVEAMHFGLAGLHLLRGAATVGLLLLMLRGILLLMGGMGPLEQQALVLLWLGAPAAGIPLLLRSRPRRGGWAWLALGIGCGALLVWWKQGGAPWTP